MSTNAARSGTRAAPEQAENGQEQNAIRTQSARWPLLRFTIDPLDRLRAQQLRRDKAVRRDAHIYRLALHEGLRVLEEQVQAQRKVVPVR